MFEKTTLKDKIILVTGGGSGLGLSMTRRFAELGAQVAICGRSEERLKKASEDLSNSGLNIMTYPIDVRDYDRVGSMFDILEGEMGQVNCLVNNAAGNFLSASEDLSPRGFQAVIDIVLTGTFNCTQHFAKRLILGKQAGSVLNIVATYAYGGCAFVLPSACAKAGVLAMTRSLAFEWAGYGIRLNAIAPGSFPTKGAWSRLMPSAEFEQKYLNKIPLGRYGEHGELANLAVYLLSDLSPYFTGECITLDGGESLQANSFSSFAEFAPRDELRKTFKSMRRKAGT